MRCFIEVTLIAYDLFSYTGVDPIGLELAGALKNVYAIAAGMSDGLGFQNNTRASCVGSAKNFTCRLTIKEQCSLLAVSTK